MSPPRNAPSAPPPAPDIVLIVLDDVGFADLGCFGAEISTPHIDALAQRGLRFNRFETRAICTPSRAALLTGRNPHDIGMADLPAWSRSQAETAPRSFRGVLPSDVEFLSQSLKSRGYRTSAIGKWHLSPEYGAPDEHLQSWPLHRGFDSFYGFIGGHTDQFDPQLTEGDRPVTRESRDGYHLTEDLVDRAIASLSDAGAGEPAFVYLATGAAHSPHQVPESYRRRYRGHYDIGWDEIRQQRLDKQKELGVVPQDTVLTERNPGDPAWTELDATRQRVAARFQEIYSAYIEHTDDQLGRLFEHVEASGRDTILILLSDNGPAPEAGLEGSFRQLYTRDDATLEEMDRGIDEIGGPTVQAMYPRPWAMVGATPFRRYKLWPVAGGTRTPLIISWPGRVRDEGAVREQYVELVDIAPTLLDWVDRAAGNSPGCPPFDGRSFGSVLHDPGASTRTTQYFELRGNRAIISDEWKAVAMHEPGSCFEDDRWMLFDHARDFSESRDVAEDEPEILERMIALWHEEAAHYIEPPLREMSEQLVDLEYFRDGYHPDHV